MLTHEYINKFFQFGRLQTSLIIIHQTEDGTIQYRFEKSFISEDGNVAEEIMEAEAQKHIDQILNQPEESEDALAD